ncbi:hypothetical protein JT55_01755 [Rhodovulum sp. NI22]|nr:hypothetical protein JT55_01755 [Rhodovulum sp. NI22]
MKRIFLASAACLAVAACSGGDGTNPITSGPTDDTEDPTTDPTTDPGTGIDSDRTVPPGTTSPTADLGIYRYEPPTDSGDGYAQSVSYDAATDTFSVDNLAFDGANTYQRDDMVGSLGPYAVYEGDGVFNDPVTGVPISQFEHKAIYGVSTNTDANGLATTQFAIVRTGAYVGYGFGGFIYQRDGGVTLPTSGQAAYSGQYAALRDFNGRGGLEYATGDMTAAIDFNDFNAGDAVQGKVTNRRVYDVNGSDITASIISALGTQYGRSYTALPQINFVVGPGVLDTNGEILGSVSSNVTDATGALQGFETGKYYAVIAGDNADEIVGVLTTEADDPRYDSVTVRETGGFILYRP